MQIAGSSAIVVGGAGGLGEATVRRLHAAGAKVVVADLADDKGKALESELGVRYVPTDATSEESVNAAIAEAASLAPLRISVDTHGGPASGGRLIGKDGSPLDLDGFKKTIEFYLTAVFNVMRLSAAAIAKSEPLEEGARGVIVNTASIAGYEGQIGQLPYSAAKGGVLGMTLVAARDLSPLGIRVVTIAPGTINTPAYGKAVDQLEQYWGPQVPFPKRMGRSTEYAQNVRKVKTHSKNRSCAFPPTGISRSPSGPRSARASRCWCSFRSSSRTCSSPTPTRSTRSCSPQTACFSSARGRATPTPSSSTPRGSRSCCSRSRVGADLEGLDDILKRFVPGSNIHAEMAGKAAVLSGAVRTPLDAKRAVDIACQFVAANKSVGTPSVSARQPIRATWRVEQPESAASAATNTSSQTQNQAAACGSDSKLVINLLTVEGEEQVMLKVTVAEVQRTLLKQFGVNLGAAINSGNFTTALLTENALPLTAAAGLGSLPIPGIGNGPVGSSGAAPVR